MSIVALALDLVLLAALLATVMPRWLLQASWPQRAPLIALSLWWAVIFGVLFCLLAAGALLATLPVSLDAVHGLGETIDAWMDADVSRHLCRRLASAAGFCVMLAIAILGPRLLWLESRRLGQRRRSEQDGLAFVRQIGLTRQVTPGRPGGRRHRTQRSSRSHRSEPSATVELSPGQQLALREFAFVRARWRYQLVALPFHAVSRLPFDSADEPIHEVDRLLDFRADDVTSRRMGSPNHLAFGWLRLALTGAELANELPAAPATLGQRADRLFDGRRLGFWRRMLGSGLACFVIAVPTLALAGPCLLRNGVTGSVHVPDTVTMLGRRPQ